MALSLAVQLCAASAIGQTDSADEAQKRRQLQRTEQELATQRERQRALESDAAQLTRDIDALRAQTILAGRSTRENEAALSALEETLSKLEQDVSAREASLKQRKRAVVALLAALQKLALQPPEAMLALPQDPKQTVRSAIAIAGSVAALEQRIGALREEMTALTLTRQKILQHKQQIEHVTKSLVQQRKTLDNILKRKQALEQKTVDEAARTASRVAQLANSAKSLKELLDRLEAERKLQETRQRALDRQRRFNKGQETSFSGTLPASGRIAIDWGQPETGGPARGLTIETRPEAIVVAPSDGTVEFAGPFRGYGQILILEHGDGYHSLVAGVNRIDVEVGQRVSAGEPIAVMGRAAEGSPLLYFELRNHGQPTNPHPWMARRTD